MSDPRHVPAAEIAALEFFADLPLDALAPIAAASRRVVLADGERLFSQGDPSASIYWVLRGRLALRITHGEARSLIVMTLGPNELVGWSTLRGEATALSSAGAVGPTELIEVPSEAVLDMLSSGTPWARLLIRRFAAAATDHLERTRAQLLDRGHGGLITGG